MIAQRVVNAAAESYKDDIDSWIASGRGFRPSQGGGLEQAISWHGNSNGSATVFVNKDYASFVEFGTGIFNGHSPWVIRNKPQNGRKSLAWSAAGGGMAFAKSVRHKGSRPHPFFFADQTKRAEHMQAKGLLVLARAING
jgi:hypothetical protein